jgi:two-component system sensor histidine kinase TctE
LPIAAKKGVELSFDLVPARIMGSRLLLNELLSNILDNAIRYVPVNGCVHVSSCQRGGGLQLTVADNGPGVATTDFEKLGVPFYRLTSKEPDGSGLGLAIAIEIARLHDAEVFFSAGIGGVGFGVNIFFAKILRVS